MEGSERQLRPAEPTLRTKHPRGTKVQLAAPPRIDGPPHRHVDLVRPGAPLGGFAELAGIKCCGTVVESPRHGPSMRGDSTNHHQLLPSLPTRPGPDPG